MDYSKVKDEIKEIVDIAECVPDRFKEKCFELLLSNFLSSISLGTPPEKITKDIVTPSTKIQIPITTQLRLFMKKTKITEDELKSILMFADGDVHFIKEPETTKVIDGQMQWAMLLALKNCILNNSLSVDPEDVRSICQEKGYYDSANFAAHFKRKKYAKLFKGPMKRQGDPQALTNEGYIELANVIRSLTTT